MKECDCPFKNIFQQSQVMLKSQECLSLKADVSQRDLYGKFQKYIHLQNNSPLTTLCLDFTEFYYISTPQLHQILLDKLLQCSLSMQRGILKSLSMQVLCFCRSSYKKFFFCVRNQMYPPMSNPGLKSAFLLFISSRSMINLLCCLIMLNCLQIFCAIFILFLSTFCTPTPSKSCYRLCLFVSAFPPARSPPFFFSMLLKRNGSICHKKVFSLSACALDVDI